MPSPNTLDQQRKLGLDATKKLIDSINFLVEQGDVDGVKSICAELASKSGIQLADFNSVLSKTKEQKEKRKSNFARDTKKFADNKSYEFNYKAPYLSIGCVRLQEKAEGSWTISILDNVPIGVIHSFDGETLVSIADKYITEIECKLSELQNIAAALKISYRHAAMGGATRVSANLLMFLCSQGREITKSLSGKISVELKPGLTRGQFGYLLKHLHRSRDEMDIQFHGATQNESKPEAFIPIPKTDDPRKISNFDRITAITIKDL